tara:strand:+ start:1358 stop:1507 length:150 start_codon:yes stop_codon:yes gene_type:complete
MKTAQDKSIEDAVFDENTEKKIHYSIIAILVTVLTAWGLAILFCAKSTL